LRVAPSGLTSPCVSALANWPRFLRRGLRLSAVVPVDHLRFPSPGDPDLVYQSYEYQLSEGVLLIIVSEHHWTADHLHRHSGAVDTLRPPTREDEAHSVRRIVALGLGSIFGDVPSMLGFMGDSTVAGGEWNPSHAVQELGSTAHADQASFTSVFVAPGCPSPGSLSLRGSPYGPVTGDRHLPPSDGEPGAASLPSCSESPSSPKEGGSTAPGGRSTISPLIL
jgi:hypothetical protein